MPKSLAEMAEEVRLVNEANGWFADERSFGDDIALLHSEVSEAFEAYRHWGLRDVTDEECPDAWGERGEDGEFFIQNHLDHLPEYNKDHVCKPEGVGSEFADVLIRLLDSCHRHGIDLDAEYERKVAHNRTRGWKHGGKRL